MLNVLVGGKEVDPNDEWEQLDDPLLERAKLEDSAVLQHIQFSELSGVG